MGLWGDVMGASFSFRRGGRALALAVALALGAAACDFTVGTDTSQLDAGFGGDDGATVLGGLRVRTDDAMTSAARLPDGRVVAVGTVGWGTQGVTRYLPDGTLDRSFGADGVATAPLEPMGDIAVAPDSAVLVPDRVWSTG